MGGCISPEQQLVNCYKCGKYVPRYALNNHNCFQANQNKSINQVNQVNKDKQVKKGQLKSTKQQPSLKAEIKPKPLNQNPFLPFLKPVFPPEPRPFQPMLYRNQAKQFQNQFIDIKEPTNSQRTLFRWKKQKTIFYPLYIKSFKPQIMRFRTFQQKLLWFRLNIEALRVNWQHGCEVLNIDRGNLVMSSKMGLDKINLRKEIKIKFDDQVVDDAGGLEREWMHMFIKQVFSPEFSIFQQCNTDQTAYKFVWDKSLDESFALQIISTLGIIIGKALFDRISLNSFLNRTILRQICQQTVLMHDVFSFDRELYKSWKSILENDGAQNLFQTFSVTKIHSDKTSQTFDLVKDGRNIDVNDKNKYQYIFQMIQLHCSKSVGKYIKALIAGIHKVIPPHFLSIFQPHQMQMLLNGPQHIDVKDWKENTLYKGYKHNDQVVVWFWAIVQKYDQKKLANLLHYCTGSTRVPILGFKYLESNRNTINKFTLQKVSLNPDNPYPKSYTCFNRLELPEYSSMAELQKHLETVIKQQINHFGLG